MNLKIPFRISALASVVGGLAATLGGCAGRNLHSDLQAKPEILLRKWSYGLTTGVANGPGSSVAGTRGVSKARDAGDHGTEYSNAVLVGQTLIFGNRSQGIIALYPEFGQVRWTFNVMGGVTSELGVDKGSLYFGGGDGFLYSLSAETGKLNWRYEIRNPQVSRPTVGGGRVFVTTTDDVVYALDAGTGKWLWHYRRRSAPPATILGASAPLLDGSEVLVGLSDGFLVSLSENDGQLKWERKLHLGTKFTDVDAHPVLVDNILYVPSYDGSLYALKRQKGEVVWRFDEGGSRQVAVEGDRLFLPSSTGSVFCLQRDSAKQIWKFDLDAGTPTQLVVTDRYVIVGSSFQYLYVIDKGTGQGVYRYNVGYGSGFTSSLTYDADRKRLYALSGGGNLYAFSVQNAPAHFPTHAVRKP